MTTSHQNHEYLTSEHVFAQDLASTATRLLKKHGLNSVKFLYSDKNESFHIKAHKFHYKSALNIMKKAKIIHESGVAGDFLAKTMT